MDFRAPRDERARLEALRRYDILDSGSEEAFDRLTEVAADALQVPIALVSLVDEDRIWFKSRLGLKTRETPREPGLCTSAILGSDIYLVRDACNDPRTASHSFVTGQTGLRFYAAAPLRTSDGFNLGVLCVIDRQPRELNKKEQAQLTRLAGMVMNQLELHRTTRRVAKLEEEQRALQEQLRAAQAAASESEERFRDLFDEAPIAYVHEGLDSRFIRANKTAMKILGIRPDEIAGTYGKTFAPDTPDAQRRMRLAFESIGRGADTSGVVLEMRRKDNGKPFWIQWWSRPDPSGTFTRTMFLDITERVQMTQDKDRLEAQNLYLQEEIRSEYNFGEVVGNSRALCGVMQLVDQVAPADSNVLITGETGTGKELIARALHERSHRSRQALVKVNCGAISAGLVESELFGHVKGAFTGALANRDGRFKVADGGTIFLDEVGELPLETQVKLLRVLQEQEFEPIGSSRSVKVDVRIVAATNRDLAEAVAAGTFRQDLFYRLNVFPLRVPPLRERKEDLPLLVSYFLQKLGKRLGKPAKQVSEDTMRRFMAYSWPGNIRELQNVIERAVILSPGRTIELPADFTAGSPAQTSAAPSPALPVVLSSPLPPANPASSTSAPPLEPRDLPMQEMERRHIEAVLVRCNWMIEGERGAAQSLGLNPSTLRSRMEKLGIKRPGSASNRPQN